MQQCFTKVFRFKHMATLHICFVKSPAFSAEDVDNTLVQRAEMCSEQGFVTNVWVKMS